MEYSGFDYDYDELFEMTLINVVNNWDQIEQNENIMNQLKSNRLLKSKPIENYQHVFTYLLLCKYLLSFPHVPIIY